MTLAEINRWLETEGRDCESAGFSPKQAVAICRWKLSDKVDHDGWTGLLLIPAVHPDLTFYEIQPHSE